MANPIDATELGALAQRGLSLLRLSESDWADLGTTRGQGTRFSLTFPHAIAHSGRPKALVLIAIVGDDRDLCLGLIRSVMATATLGSRVVVDLVQPIEPRSLEILAEGLAERTLLRGATKLVTGSADFQPVTKKLGIALIAKIASAANNISVLRRILAEIDRPKRFENALALQEDAVAVALKVFGVIDGAESVALPGSKTSIGTVRLQEDTVIEHDARWIPGWRLADSDLTGKAVFTRRDEQLEVFTANKRPLEQLFGVDLLYLNRLRGALVMVQYKMMESRDKGEVDSDSDITDEQPWTVPIDAQFREELKRMARFDKDLAPGGPYRLNPGAFFFKLVRRHSDSKSAGIVLSMGHLNQLISEGVASGPRGGLRISYKALKGHYLRSNSFVDLVSSGYIGTRGATTDHLQSLVEAALVEGRAVVAAIQSAIDKPNSSPPSWTSSRPEKDGR